MSKECETLLYMAARAQLVEEVIIPALKKGQVILCDRFSDSTTVYQGYGNEGNISLIKKIGLFATKEIIPDLTFVFDIDAQKGLSRIKRAKDRIEIRPLAYHNRVRNGYFQLTQQEPGRIKLIKADNQKEIIHAQVIKHVNKILSIK